MRKYWVFWTYCANYSVAHCQLDASSPEECIAIVKATYGEHFIAKATVYVYEMPPCFVSREGKVES